MNALDDTYAAAADWHCRLADEDDSPATCAEFDAWLAADPRHARAFAAVEQAWGRMSDARVEPRIMELRREALSATQRPRTRRLAAIAATIVALAVGVGYVAATRVRPSSNEAPLVTSDGGEFRTAVGERSNVTLSDGSSVVLNTRSRIDVHFTAGQRNVRLLSGQAWFQVARDANRPFVVEAGDQRVTALGTAFDVRLGEKDSVQVTLAEGRVSVEPIRSSLARMIRADATPAQLLPGEALTVSGDAPMKKRKADLSKVNGWRQGQVVFDNDTLESAVAEVNRYSPVRIELADAALATLRVSGVFKAGHSESFVETVTGHYPIRIASRDEASIVLTSLTP